MIKHFKMAWKNIVSKKLYNAINILGLSVAIAVVLVIFTYVFSEKSFDKFNAGYNKTYRLLEYVHYPGGQPELSASGSYPVLPLLKSTHSEIEKYARIIPVTPNIYTSASLVYNNNTFKAERFVCADSSLAGILTMQWLAGGNNGFLKMPNSIVLTEQTAKTMFPNAKDAVNKTVKIAAGDTSFTLTITGVLKDFPVNSHLQVDAFMPFPGTFEKSYLGDNWGALMGPGYLVLKNGADANALAAQFTNTIHKKNKFVDVSLQPLQDVHLGSSDILYDDFNFQKSDKKYPAIFSIVALFVLLIAGMNFINLTMSVAGFRGKEIAVKKIVGAARKTLFMQILLETFLTVCIATAAGVIIEILVLPYMNSLLGRNLSAWSLVNSANLVWLLVGVIIGMPLVAGFFPSYAISRININKALKSKVLFGSKGTLRGALVTVQFTIAIVLVVGIIVIARQMDFINKSDLGYKYDQVISIQTGFADAAKYDILSSEFKKIGHVKDISFSRQQFGTDADLYGIDYTDAEGKNQKISMNTENVGVNYIPFFSMSLVSGRNFSAQSHEKEYVINESFAKQIGWKNAVGQSLSVSPMPRGTIVGVVKDFHFNSLHHKIEPLVIGSLNSPYWMRNVYVKVSPGDVAGTIAQIKAAWQRVTGNTEIEYNFMDEHFKNIYKADRQGGVIIGILSSMAIFIACLGLFGLTTHAIQRRLKEISMRKVLGADVSNIVALLSRDFLKFIAIAAVIAFPVSWLIMNKWLDNFAYRITISWWMLVVAGVSSLLVAILTISVQAIKAAMANPVKNLKTE